MQLITQGVIDKTGSMYPTFSELVDQSIFKPPMYSTTYGVVISGEVEQGIRTYREGEYFCTTLWHPQFHVNGKAWFVSRIGFYGQNMTGHMIEPTGRLTYIDHCSSTILVYPPRFGDPSLHLLYFPHFITQTPHTHPSIRIGLILDGEGLADTDQGTKPLRKDMVFCLNEQEIHNFRTLGHSMRIIAFHPDGDWGPTDESHPMLNRTHTGVK